MNNLSAAGLSETDAKVYSELLKKTEYKPSDLVKIVGETRTNLYKILDRLVSLGLAIKFDKDKKIHYRAANPARLIELARELREARESSEKELELATQNLMSDYIKSHEQPGVRYYQGPDQIASIFESIAKAKSEVLFVHTDKGIDFFSYDTMHKLRMLAVKAGVKRRALTPDVPRATVDYKEKDPAVLLKRTWLENGDYTAPVEWGVFDDTLYIISYGKEALALTIESKQVTEAFRQIFKIIEKGQKHRPNYEKLPVVAALPGRND